MSHTPAMFHGPVGARTGVTFFINGTPYHADKSVPHFDELIAELRKGTADNEKLIALTKPAQAIIRAIEAAEAAPVGSADYLPKGTVSVTTSEVRYNGEVVDGVLVDRILEALAEGFNVMPYVRFLENLYQNPGTWARDELYLWLEKSNLPITEDGHFLAYKSVKPNFRSHHGGVVDNTPGKIVSMPRSQVDSVRAHLCSTGLHFCSLNYLGKVFSNQTIVILKINPADVVAIPSDYDNSKGRAWRYEVLSKFGEDAAEKVWPAIVSPTGTPVITDPAKQSLVIGSDLAKALFAAGNEIGLTERSARLRKASAILGLSTQLRSYDRLTVGQASKVLEAFRFEKQQRDARAQATAAQAQRDARTAAARAKNALVDAIDSYGIETLRREASKAGFTAATGRSAYKNAVKAELVQFLKAQVK